MTRSIKEDARRCLAAASYDPKKLALIHTGAAMLASVAISLLSYILNLGIAETGGLSGIGSRAVLSSAQSVLGMALTVLLPFWELGFLYAALGMARQKEVGINSLTEGLRRFGPALRLFLLQAVLVMGTVMACMYAAYTVFMFTPFFESTFKALEPLASSANELVMDEALLEAVLPTLVPLYVIMGVLLLIVGAPIFYRYRMARFALMDDASGARNAMGISTRIMRGNRLTLFKVDLSFWWYYALQLLLSAVAYGDVILEALGVTLPVSADVSYWLFYGVYLVLRLLVAWKFAAYVQTGYARCYHTFRQYATAPDPAPQTPDGMPKE